MGNCWGFCCEIGAWVIVSPPYGTFIRWCNSPKISSSRADDTCLLAADIASHYNDVTVSLMASRITSLTIVYSTVYSGADQRKHQSSASLAFVRGLVNSPHKWPVTRKMIPFDDIIMIFPSWWLGVEYYIKIEARMEPFWLQIAISIPILFRYV